MVVVRSQVGEELTELKASGGQRVEGSQEGTDRGAIVETKTNIEEGRWWEGGGSIGRTIREMHRSQLLDWIQSWMIIDD